MKEKIILLKDEEWSVIDREVCRVKSFNSMGNSVKDGKVIAMNMTTPYASIDLECKKLSGEITGFITHKIDFTNLWNAFKKRGVKENEEVLIWWSVNHYKNKIFKVLSRAMPKLWVMVCPKNALERLTDNNYQSELGGEARAKAMLPIIDWKPDIME